MWNRNRNADTLVRGVQCGRDQERLTRPTLHSLLTTARTGVSALRVMPSRKTVTRTLLSAELRLRRTARTGVFALRSRRLAHILEK